MSTDVRSFLKQMADEVDVSALDARAPVARARRYRSVAKGVTALIVLAIAAAGFVGLRSFTESRKIPANVPTPSGAAVPPGSRPVFQRTATIGGLTITSPSNWFLVDYWGNWNPDATSLDNHAIPMLEVTNFDPGLSTPVCDTGPGERTRLPADGVAIFVIVGNGGGNPADLCGGNIDTSFAGTVGTTSYTSVMTFGPDATQSDRATAEQIWRSVGWNGPLRFYARGRSPRYVLDGWQEGSTTGLLEALPSSKNVELSLIQTDGTGSGEDTVSDVGVPHPNAIQGGTFGAVTQKATRVEYRRAGVTAPREARLIDLPPSLHAAFDAYVVEPQPTEGDSEVLAIGAGGQILGSNLPPLTETSKIGTVRAFGTTWAVKLSTSADGYYGSTCVEPAAKSTLSPCDRGWGAGLLVQTFDGPQPAVFVTEEVGDVVTAIDLHADDGRVFHAVMVQGPNKGHGGLNVAVIALEGGGHGRLVYHMSNGGTDEGRRPEAQISWPDLGQVIGNGSFPPPGKA